VSVTETDTAYFIDKMDLKVNEHLYYVIVYICWVLC